MECVVGVPSFDSVQSFWDSVVPRSDLRPSPTPSESYSISFHNFAVPQEGEGVVALVDHQAICLAVQMAILWRVQRRDREQQRRRADYEES